MLKIIIIEDEIPARKKIRRFLEEYEVEIQIIGEIGTVELAIKFLKNNKVDLIFSDIELLDGNAFDIYSKVSVTCPIIFTTAYDHFWMDAFESNGIDYLLKPFSKDRFKKAFDKFLLLRNNSKDQIELFTQLYDLIEKNARKKEYKKRFTVHTHQRIYLLNTENITFFEANEGVVFAFDTKGNKHLLSESTLKEIEEQLDPFDFFRINRSEIVSKQYLEKIERYNKNTLAIKMIGHVSFLKTSQNNTSNFRIWIDK